MVFEGKISAELRAYVRYLRSESHLSLRDIASMCDISYGSAQRFAKSSLPKITKVPSRKSKPGQCKEHLRVGRPKGMSARTERYVERELNKMREDQGTFYISDLMANTGLTSDMVSERTVRRSLNRKGYGFFQSRRKGVLNLNDYKQRLKFARANTKKYPAEFWSDGISFYLDAVKFVYKTKPGEQARAPGTRTWRKKSYGLNRGSTAKGRKEGTGGRYVKLIVAITYGKGVIACEPYEEMNGEYFASFIDNNFREMFDTAEKDSTTWIQDGDPSQNSALAKAAMKRVKANLLNIPARSPDINPIENIFHLASRKLKHEAIRMRIEKEDFDEFQARVINVIYGIPVVTINNTIASMDKRLREIIEKHGGRTKY